MGQAKYKICKLNKVAWFQEGPGVRKSQFRTSGVKLLNVRNICDRKLVLDKTSIYISEEEAYGKYKHFLIDEGDLLIASSGIKVDYFDKKITFAKKEHLPLCMNTSTIRFKVLDETQLDIHYLRHFLASRYFTKQVQFYITGSAQLNFGPSHLNEMTIILPSLVEQKKIAKILDKADEIRTKKKQANEKLDEFLKSTFVDMFGDPVKNEKGWKTESLSSVAPIRSYNGSVKENDGKYWLLNLDVVESNTGKILEYNYEESIPNSTCCFNSNMVLYSKLRPYLNKVVLPNKTGYATSELVPLNPIKEKLNKYFLASLLRSRCFVNDINIRVAGAKMPRVSMDYLRNFSVILPPIEEQNKYAQIVEKVEEQKQRNEKVIEQMDNLFNSLSQKAFKGEL